MPADEVALRANSWLNTAFGVMRIVFDSNRLQSGELRSYLARSKQNFAVLTDYAAMEAYKGDTLSSIYKSMEIVAEFPRQVIVLKSTMVICGLNGRGAGLQRRFIDKSQTRGFVDYARNLRLAREGDRRIQDQLLEHGRVASEHLDRMLQESQSTGAAFGDIAKDFSKEERRLVRNGEPYTSEMVDRIVKTVIRIAADAFKNHPKTRVKPAYDELPNTFIFRAALCAYLLALHWGAVGGLKGAKASTLRNDMVDMSFAAYATYFDGLLSTDDRANWVHQEARLFLAALFRCHLHGTVI